MSEDMPEDMPEDMSDRMLEDLSVRKYINVMVGITRNKIIWKFNIYFIVFNWEEKNIWKSIFIVFNLYLENIILII